MTSSVAYSKGRVRGHKGDGVRRPASQREHLFVPRKRVTEAKKCLASSTRSITPRSSLARATSQRTRTGPTSTGEAGPLLVVPPEWPWLPPGRCKSEASGRALLVQRGRLNRPPARAASGRRLAPRIWPAPQGLRTCSDITATGPGPLLRPGSLRPLPRWAQPMALTLVGSASTSRVPPGASQHEGRHLLGPGLAEALATVNNV